MVQNLRSLSVYEKTVTISDILSYHTKCLAEISEMDPLQWTDDMSIGYAIAHELSIKKFACLAVDGLLDIH
jgi:hypothetical protein